MVLVFDSWDTCHLWTVTSIGVDIYPTSSNNINNNSNKTTLDHYLFLHAPTFMFCSQGISFFIAHTATVPCCISKCSRVCGSWQSTKVVVFGWYVRGGKSNCCPVLGSGPSSRSRCHPTGTDPTCCNVNISHISSSSNNNSPLLDELSFHSNVQSFASSNKDNNNNNNRNTVAVSGGTIFGLLSVLSDGW